MLRMKLDKLKTRKTRSNNLNIQERKEAEIKILSIIQNKCFSTEIKRLTRAQKERPGKITVAFYKTTRFDKLNPFIDDDGLL